jgi:hypothetical protein
MKIVRNTGQKIINYCVFPELSRKEILKMKIFNTFFEAKIFTDRRRK